MGSFLAAIGFLSSLAWPLDDPTAPNSAFSLPENQPNDPDFFSEESCAGQFGLLGFVPACMPNFVESEAVGLGLDRAWTLGLGRPEVTVAVVTEGIDVTHPDLAGKIRLHSGELPGVTDPNGDGVLTVLELQLDPAFEDRNDNGRADAQDALLIYSNGIDDDGNGLVDDIAGWDFYSEDNDPSPSEDDLRGTGVALAAAAETNNGIGGAGACPNCTILPIRAGQSGRSHPHQLAFSLQYASHRGAATIAVETSVPGLTNYLRRSFETVAATAPIFVSSGESRRRSELLAVPVEMPGVVTTSAYGFDGDKTEASSSKNPIECARTSGQIIVPGQVCEGHQDAGILAGLAALIASTSTLSPSGLTSLLKTTPDALSAVQAAQAGQVPPSLTWILPSNEHPVDPTPGAVQVRLRSDQPIAWRLQTRFGAGDFEDVTFGQLFASGFIETELSISGLMPDPAIPAQDLSKHQLVIRVVDGSDRVLAERTLLLGADLDLYPGFPVALGSGAYGGPRFADVDGDGMVEIWVALLDGRLVSVNRFGAIFVDTPGREIENPGPWAVVEPKARVPFVGTPSLRRTADGNKVAVVDSEAVLLEYGAQSVRSFGQPIHLGHLSPNPLTVDRQDGSQEYIWAAPEGVRSTAPDLAQTGNAVQALAQGRELYLWSGASLHVDQLSNQPIAAAAPIQPRGLSGFVPPSVLVLIQEEERAYLPGVSGTLIIENQRVVSIGQAPAFPQLSSDAVGWLGYFVGAESIELTVFGQPIYSEIGLPGLDPPGGEVIVADIDGGEPELIFAPDGYRLDAISENSSSGVGWPKLTGQAIMGPAVAGDFNGDGLTDIAAVSRSGYLFLWRTSGETDRIRWSGAGHDSAASGNANRSIVANPARPEEDGCRCLQISRPSKPLWTYFLIGAWLAYILGARRAARLQSTTD